MSIVSPAGVAQCIVVRRSGFALWLEIDGVMIGLHPHASIDVDVDPSDTPYINLKLYANRIYVDNSEYVAPDDRGEVGYGEADSQTTEEATEDSVRVPVEKGLPDP